MSAERVMHEFRKMNYTAFRGENRVKGLEAAEKMKVLSWSRSRPGEHGDLHLEDLLEQAKSAAQEFKSMHEQAAQEAEEDAEARVAASEAYDKAAEEEAKRREAGERPPVEPAASAQPA